jgi:hypothetical protein
LLTVTAVPFKGHAMQLHSSSDTAQAKQLGSRIDWAKRALIGAAFGCFSVLGACTTIPESDDFLSKSDGLTASKGVRGKRLETLPPAREIGDGARLFLEPAILTQSAVVAENITDVERSLVLNALMRSICSDMSRKFEIVEAADMPDTYRMRMGVSRIAATGKIGATVGNITSFVIPVVGLRPPIGLGGLTVEFELVEPNGTQAAAMVWSRSADMVSQTSASRIGDAYGFTSEASSSFANLITRPTGARRASQALGVRLPGNRSDEACAKYGREAGRIASAFSALAIPLPPEMTDKGEVKKP